MIKQSTFNFNFTNLDNEINFYVNSTNSEAYNGILNNSNHQKILIGERKSGKSFLGRIWVKKNSAFIFNNNLEEIINHKKNILIDDVDKNKKEEELFHIINHCTNHNLKLLIISNREINQLNFKLNDLISRLKIFFYFHINNPNDDMLINILTKLITDKQFIISSDEIFSYIIKRANRSYYEMFNIVEKLDTLSLEKKRQLTIPLIRELL